LISQRHELASVNTTRRYGLTKAVISGG
jgi:hypothetical protein